jgi:tetratricopeptide (TPR) repeat protein
MARREFQQIGQGTETDRDLQELCLAMVDLYAGRLETAKAELTKQIQMAAVRGGGLQPFRRYLLGRIDLMQGTSHQANVQADLILQMPNTRLQIADLLDAGILYARAGRISRARQILHRLDNSRKSVPTSWNQSCFYNLQGEIAMATARPQEAESSFMAAAHEYPQFFPHIGLARLQQARKRWDLAAREWEQVISRKGEILQNDFPPELAYAHLELAANYRLLDKSDLARTHYEEVLRMWQHADELPVLKHAHRELQSLSPQVRSVPADPIDHTEPR